MQQGIWTLKYFSSSYSDCILLIANTNQKLAIICVAVPVAIATNPEPATRVVGDNITFTCAASGSGNLIFMWYKDGDSAPLMAGGNVRFSNEANESSLILTNIAPTDAGSYYCVASNTLVGSVFNSTSSQATLTVQGKILWMLCNKFRQCATFFLAILNTE